MPPEAATVVTVVSGRHQHLLTQRAFLAACDPPPARHIVVAIDDPAIAPLLDTEPDLPTTLLELPRHPAGLPIAAARNAGARAAISAGADLLVFLDVDCIPQRSLLGAYATAADSEPNDLLCGAVTYLPPTPPDGWRAEDLAQARAPHAARPDPAPGILEVGETRLFWSLSFALRATTWAALPGFYEGYVGYGAEDTDFAEEASTRGRRVVFVGGADAFHQHHAVSDPPVEHLDDIVRNSAVFQSRHGHLPMTGWISAFESRGLVTRHDGPPRRTDATRVATVPPRHPYLDAVLPPAVTRVDTGRVHGWEPDPLLDPAEFASRAHGIDLVHVHFAFEHRQPAELQKWIDALAEFDIPLVLTVHDLHNPHQRDPARHREHLQLLGRAASRGLTLTEHAAERCRTLIGRPVEVVAHPTLVDTMPPADPIEGVLVPLKALRANVVDAVAIAETVAAAALSAGERTRVLLEPSTVGRPEHAALLDMAACGAIDLVLEPYLPEPQLLNLVAGSRAVVLPYRFGTHSGWVELAHDLGTRVIAPDCGSYHHQWTEVLTYGNNERTGLDRPSLAAAVRTACRLPAPPPADPAVRRSQRDLARAFHDALYRDVLSR